MSISDFQPVKNAERVCTHKLAFTTARTIFLGALSIEISTPYFSRNDFKMLSKYSRSPAHHARIRRIVLNSKSRPFIFLLSTLSIVWVPCLLYGITKSGSS